LSAEASAATAPTSSGPEVQTISCAAESNAYAESRAAGSPVKDESSTGTQAETGGVAAPAPAARTTSAAAGARAPAATASATSSAVWAAVQANRTTTARTRSTSAPTTGEAAASA